MSDSIQRMATRCAARVDSDGMRFDPLTILTIFTQVLPLLMNCLQTRATAPTTEAMCDYIRREHADNPRKLQKRIAGRIRGEADYKMTKEEAYALADAVIAEGLAEQDDTEVRTFMAACAAYGI